MCIKLQVNFHQPSAYLDRLCEQQSCLSHLLRKVRKFPDAFPHLTDIVNNLKVYEPETADCAPPWGW